MPKAKVSTAPEECALPAKRVCFDCYVQEGKRRGRVSVPKEVVPDQDDPPNEVREVRNESGSRTILQHEPRGLVESLEVGGADVTAATQSKSERVICSVKPIQSKGVEAVSPGYIDGYPVELLIDSGAIASLVDRRVLRLLGREGDTLRPYGGGLNGVTGSPLRLKGVIDLTVRIGSVERLFPFVVTDKLHVDAILGTDALAALRAVIDLEDGVLTLKDSGEVFPLGVELVERTSTAAISRSMQLVSGGQALVVAVVSPDVKDGTSVLVEGLPSLDPTVRVAEVSVQ